MTIFLILAPYGAFSALMLLTSATPSLLAATFVCAGTIAFDVWRGRSFKILAVGSASCSPPSPPISTSSIPV